MAFLFTAAGSFDVHFSWFSDHPVAAVVIVVGGVALAALALVVLYHRFQKTWENAKEGGAILRHPRRYFVQVVAVEAASYAARMGVNATFMYAYHIPVSLKNVFLIVAASSISSTVAVLPGAVGAQTGLASVVLRDVASQSTITAYTVGQALITTAWNGRSGSRCSQPRSAGTTRESSSTARRRRSRPRARPTATSRPPIPSRAARGRPARAAGGRRRACRGEAGTPVRRSRTPVS